ncbi:MAG TPA: DUF5317 family protein [Acidimicrobiales bacterium]
MVVALAAGVVIGYLTGGRLRAMGEAELRWSPAMMAGIALQVASVFVDGFAGVTLVLASFALIVAFTAMNLTKPGMGVVLVGVALNAIVIGVNGGMPVRADAIVAAGIADRDEIDELDFESKRHLETDDDEVTFLGDILPVPFARVVLSFGDLVMTVGVADVVVHLMRTGRRGATRVVRPPGQEGSG